MKLWPVSTSDALVEPFHFGRPGIVDVGRGSRLPVGVAELSRDGVLSVDKREDSGARLVV